MHAAEYGAELICAELSNATLTSHEHNSPPTDPGRLPARPSLGGAWTLRRKTIPVVVAERRLDRVQRRFHATRPKQLWVADFIDVAPWAEFVYQGFIVSVCARRIIGWRVTHSRYWEFVLDLLEQVLHARRASQGLIHTLTCTGHTPAWPASSQMCKLDLTTISFLRLYSRMVRLGSKILPSYNFFMTDSRQPHAEV
jgi:hypothetical protein